MKANSAASYKAEMKANSAASYKAEMKADSAASYKAEMKANSAASYKAKMKADGAASYTYAEIRSGISADLFRFCPCLYGITASTLTRHNIHMGHKFCKLPVQCAVSPYLPGRAMSGCNFALTSS